MPNLPQMPVGVRDVWTTDKMQFGVGSDLTFYSKTALLETIYGNNPVSWKLFFPHSSWQATEVLRHKEETLSPLRSLG